MGYIIFRMAERGRCGELGDDAETVTVDKTWFQTRSNININLGKWRTRNRKTFRKSPA